MTYDAIIYGTICLDVIWRVRDLPPPGGYADVLEERKAVGGEAANTAIALTRWGARVALLGNLIGDDEEGVLPRDLFARDAPDIDLGLIRTAHGGETPYCLCIATADGDRTMIGRGFQGVETEPLDPALAREARVFTMDPNQYEAGLRACQVAAGAGMAILPMDYTREPEVNRASEIVVTSTDHVGDMGETDIETYAAGIRDADGPTAIITRGPRGCIVAERGVAAGTARRLPAYTAPEVIDSTGAGDIFRAGLIYGTLRAWDLDRTLRFASAAAALNCTAMGGWGGVRTVSEIEAFQRQSP